MDQSPPSIVTKDLDAALHKIGFVIDYLSPHKVSGHLLITSECLQGFNVLSGGVSAMIAETLGSLGAHVASGRRRVVGVHLSINHLKTAKLGDLVLAEGTPVNVGKTIQVWEVRLYKSDPSDHDEIKTLISSSTVTVLCNLPVPESVKSNVENAKKYYSKL